MTREQAQAIVRELVEQRHQREDAEEILDALAIPRGEHVVGFGFVVRWPAERTLGWRLPNSLTGHDRKYGASQIVADDGWAHIRGQTSVLCRITAERILDSRGREIRRIVK